MNSKIRNLCKARGICCPWKFMVQLQKRSSFKIAQTFNVTQRTARNWKKWKKDGDFQCEGCSNCQKRELLHIDLVEVKKP